MKADKAKQLVREHVARDKLKDIYKRIEREAKLGRTKLEVGPSELNEIQVQILESDGYKVEEQVDYASHHYDRSKRVGWKIKWE